MKFPDHVGFILDGNRTYARRLGKKPWDGHKAGFDLVIKLIDWCLELELKEITCYAFSIQNFKRDKLEVKFLMDLFNKLLSDYLGKDFKFFEERQVQINFMGRLYLFEDKIHSKQIQLMKKTKSFHKLKVNFAIAYGGREEIIDAAKTLSKDIKSGKLEPEDIDEEKFAEYLYLSSYPDLIIRTSGQIRTSNFLPWQSTYSEWIFLKETWPEFSKELLQQCIDEYSTRQRRYGK